MSKVSRKGLERGKKLVKEHVFDPLSAVVTDLNAAGLDAEQLEAEWAPFRLNYSIPYFASDSISPELSIPFVLPPLQDTMTFDFVTKAYTDSSGNNTTTTSIGSGTSDTSVVIFLDEVSFGFDQRDAPAAIASQYYNSPNGRSDDEGKLCYDLISQYDIRLSILEKEPLFFVPPDARAEEDEVPRREVWSVDIDHTSFANDVFALNPFVVSDINIQIDPWKSYVFTMAFPKIGAYLELDLGDTNPAIAVVSIEASLRFRSKVMKRNTRTTWAPDNAPTSALTKRSRTAAGNPVSITVPADGAKITADPIASGGVNASIAAVDEAFRAGIYAGFNEHCEAGKTVEAIAEELDPDSAYEVLTVPLFQNSNFGGVAYSTALVQPYGSEAAINDVKLIDRRVIPINYPMQIEHVIVGMNWQTWRCQSSGSLYYGLRHPSYGPALFTYDFGVGIGTGIQGDDFDYAQIARTPDPWVPGNSPENDVVDKIRVGPDRVLPLASATTKANNLSLWCLPLTHGTVPVIDQPAYRYDDAVTPPLGFQSKPAFVGRAWTPTQTRTGALPGTVGKEQWIEVRGQIGIPAAGSSPVSQSLLVGYQGIFVYIIGRKFLAS